MPRQFAPQPIELTAFASAARTASENSPDLESRGCKGAVIVIDATAASLTPSVVFTVKGKSSLGGDYWTILASAAVTGAGQTVLRIYPGLTASANAVASDVLPRLFRVEAVHADTDPLTYSVSVNLIP